MTTEKDKIATELAAADDKKATDLATADDKRAEVLALSATRSHQLAVLTLVVGSVVTLVGAAIPAWRGYLVGLENSKRLEDVDHKLNSGMEIQLKLTAGFARALANKPDATKDDIKAAEWAESALREHQAAQRLTDLK